jgi:hypothetical protein
MIIYLDLISHIFLLSFLVLSLYFFVKFFIRYLYEPYLSEKLTLKSGTNFIIIIGSIIVTIPISYAYIAKNIGLSFLFFGVP